MKNVRGSFFQDDIIRCNFSGNGILNFLKAVFVEEEFPFLPGICRSVKYPPKPRHISGFNLEWLFNLSALNLFIKLKCESIAFNYTFQLDAYGSIYSLVRTCFDIKMEKLCFLRECCNGQTR